MLREERDSGKSQEIPGCHPNCDCERFVELWNLVFMQFYQDPERNRTPLPAPSVDTGMGLERAAAVLQQKSNIFETDLLWPMVAKACELTGKSYGVDLKTDYALRVVAEHSRAATFLIGDGVVPGNAGRGYVLRRVVRRAIRYGRRLGLEQPFLTDVAEVVLENFRADYRELLENHDFILRVIRLEEERFAETYERGISILDGIINYRALYRSAIPDVIDFARQHAPGVDNASSVLEQYGLVGPHTESSASEMIGQEMAAELVSELANEAFRALNGDREFEDEDLDSEGRLQLLSSWGETISGKETFVLYDTYGFPVELTAEIAREAGLEVDMDGLPAGDGLSAGTVPLGPGVYRQHGNPFRLRKLGSGADPVRGLPGPPPGVGDRRDYG